MEFKVGTMIMIQGQKFLILSANGIYALASSYGEKIVDGGGMLIIVKKTNDGKTFDVCTEEKEITEAIKLMGFRK